MIPTNTRILQIFSGKPKYRQNFILDEQYFREYYSLMTNSEETLDEKSLEILKILQEKARIPNVDISRQVNLAASAVLERIRKLEKQGFIDGYEVRLNPERFRKSLISFVRIYLAQSADLEQIGKSLEQIEEVQEVHFITGEDCFFIKMRVEDHLELGSMITRRIMTIPGVSTTKTSTVLSTYKETARIPIVQQQ